MARTAKEWTEQHERANAFVLGAAIEHHDDTAHAVHVIAGLGWVCETCDDDWRECLAEYVNGGE
jgi:hypothetical protein